MPNGATQTVLVVDDNELARNVTRMALLDAGYAVEEAADGGSALRAIEQKPIDLVLLDIRLPDMNGYDLADRIRESPAGERVPIVVCSALPKQGDHARGVRAGVSDYLFKPVSSTQVVSVVRSHLIEKARLHAAVGQRYRVMVVDDEPVQRKLTSILLTAEGYDVVTAADGEEALNVARRLTPDAIVSDVLMPRLDGFRLCSAVRGDPLLMNVPVILCSSAYTEHSDGELAKQVGANALVKRSGNHRAVLSALETALVAGASPDEEDTRAAAMEPYLARVSWQLDRQLSLNARLLRQLAVREAELAILRQATQTMSRGDSVSGTLSTLLHACLDAAGLSCGAVYLSGPDQSLSLHATLGYPPAQQPLLARFFGKLSLLTSVVGLDHTVVIPGPEVPEADAERLLRLAGLRGLLIAPIPGHGEGGGVLWMGSELREIDADWTGFAMAVAGQIGHAVALGRAFTKLAEAEQRYRLIFEEAGEGLFQLTMDRVLTLANPAFVRCVGAASTPKLIAQHCRFPAFFVQPALASALCDAALTRTASAELEVRRPTGENAWLLVTLSAVRDNSGIVRSLDGLAVDMTDRRRAQELSNIEQTQRMQMQIKDQFLSQVSHELRTPLAVIDQYASILLDGLSGELGAEQREHLETITRNAVQLRAMVDDLLEVSRAATMSPSISAMPMTIGEVIEGSIDTFAATAREKHVLLSSEVEAAIPAVLADPARVTQVLMNLVGNALKFTPASGSVIVRAALEEGSERRVRVSVADTGPGIAPNEIDRVFEYLFQGENTSQTTRRGFGIGLYVCRDLVTRQGGKIWVESTVGRGTTFFFTLPLVAAEAPIAAGTK